MAGRNPRNNPNYCNNGEDDNIPPSGFNLNHADMMAIATIVANTLQGLVNSNTNQQHPPPPPNEIKYQYESLHKNRCPTFMGDSNPEAGHNWLKNM